MTVKTVTFAFSVHKTTVVRKHLFELSSHLWYKNDINAILLQICHENVSYFDNLKAVHEMGKLGDSDILVEKWRTGTIYKE